jgi:hypothetical protein
MRMIMKKNNAVKSLQGIKRYNKNMARKKSYSKLSKNQIVNLKKDRKRKYPNKTIWASSSSTLTLDRVYEVMEKENSNTAHIIIHHSNSLDEEEWHNNRYNKFVRLQNYSKSPLVVEYESISGWNDNDIVS